MAKLPRIIHKLFGSAAGATEIGKFGSLAAGSPVTTADPTVMQALANWGEGWFAAILGNNSPAIEDMNAVCYVLAYQLAYLFQAGIAEWETNAIYYIGSLVNSGGVIYVSLTDNNTGNALTSTANWQVRGGGFRTITTDTVGAITDDLIRGNPAANTTIQYTLPAVASSRGLTIRLKNISTSANNGLLKAKGNASENLDGDNTIVMNPGDSYSFFCNGTSWDILG